MAAGTLGTLSIDVLANIAGMVSDMGKAQQESAKAAKEFQRQWTEANNAVTESFKTLAEVVGVGFGIEKITEFTKSVVEAGLQIYDISLKTGISAQTLSSYSVAAQEAGVTVDVFANSLSKMARSANDAAHGGQAQAAAFQQLGVSVTDAAGHLKGADELLGEVAQGLDKLQDGLGKTAIVTEIFGRGGATLIPLLSDLGEGVDAARQKAIAFGLAIDDTQAKALKQFDVTLTDAGLAIRGAFTQALVAALPSLQQASEQILDFVTHSQGIKDAVTDGANAVEFLAGHMQEVSTVLKDLAELAAAQLFLKLADQVTVLAKGLMTAGEAALTLKAAFGSIIPLIASAQIGSAIGGWANQFNAVKEAAVALVGVVVIGWDYIKGAADAAFAGIGAAWNMVAGGIEKSFASLISSIAGGLSDIPGQSIAAAQMQAYADSLVKAANSSKGFVQSVTDSVAATNAQVAADKENIQGLVDYYGQTQKTGVVLKEFEVTTNDAKIATDGFAKSLNSGAGKAFESDIQKLNDLMAQISSGLGGPYLAALKQFQEGQDLLNKTWADAVVAGTATHALLLQLQGDEDVLEQRYAQTTERIKEQHDQFAKLNDELNLQTTLLHTLPQDQEAVTASLKAVNEALKNNVDLYGDAIPQGKNIRDVLNAEMPAWLNLKQNVIDETAAVKANQEVMKEWASIASGAFDSAFTAINKDIIEGGSVMKDLVNVAKQVVEAILLQFEKLAIINPILNSIFGVSAGGGSLLPTLENSALSSLLGGGATASGASIASDIGSGLSSDISSELGGSSSAGMLGNLSSADTISSNANGLMGWLFGSSAGSALAGQATGDVIGGSSAFGFGTDTGGFFGGEAIESAGDGAIANGTSSSLFSQFSPYLSVIGGALAGINEFNAAGGGAGGVAGGLAYGVGTFALGTAATAGIAAAAAGGLSAGVAAGMAAIPVVGWIALAAMGVNMLTGGGLFGTAAKPIGGNETETVTSSGASVSAEMTEKGKKALFGGSYYEQDQLPVDQKTQDAANAFFNALQSSVTAFSTALGQGAASVVGGVFDTKFDKNGKATGTTDTVLGQTYTGETQQQFAERLQADSYLAVLDKMGLGASAFVAGVQGDADKLFAAVEDMAGTAQAAQADAAKGMSLLGSSDSSLVDIMQTVESLQQGTDTLEQTYSRLQGEQMDLTATLDELGLTTGKTGSDFVTFADQLTAAAGGLQNLDALWASFAKNFYTTGEIANGQLDNAKKTADQALAAIGESATVSMDQFRKDFEAALPTLTPAEVAEWLQAGNALATVNSALASIAGAQQQYADYEVQTQGDAFVQSMVKVVESEKAAIDNANALAKAAGLAGASQQDLAAIMKAGSVQLTEAIASIANSITQDVTSLYGAKYAAATAEGLIIPGSNTAVSQAQAQQQATALDAIQKIGDYAFASGDSITDVLNRFGVDTAQLAKTLGETPDQVSKQIAAQVKSDSSLVTIATQGATQTGLLTDIRDILEGKAPTFDLSSLVAPGTRAGLGTPFSGDPIGGRNLTGPVVTSSPDVVAAHFQTSSDIVAALDRHAKSNTLLAQAMKNRNTRQQYA